MRERLRVLLRESQLLKGQQAQVQLRVLAQPVALPLALQLVLARWPVPPERMRRLMNR
jgi:hypothetical protein